MPLPQQTLVIGVFQDDSGEGIVVGSQPLSFFLGTENVIKLQVKNADGSPHDLTAGAIILTVRKNPLDVVALLSREGTLTIAGEGLADINIEATDLNAIFPIGGNTTQTTLSCVYDITFVDSDGNRTSVVPGVIKGFSVAPPLPRFIVTAAAGRVGDPVTAATGAPPLGQGPPGMLTVPDLAGRDMLPTITLETYGIGMVVITSDDLASWQLTQIFPTVEWQEYRASGNVPVERLINTGTGLQGGGDLSTDLTLSIATTGVSAGDYGFEDSVPTFTVNAEGQITSAVNVPIQVVESQVTGLIASLASKLNLSGGTMTGAVDFGGFALGNAGAPLLANDVATKSYVDAVAANLAPKAECMALSSANLALSGLPTIDGYPTIDGDRVLLIAQTTGSQNGLWVAHAGAWTRPTDFATGNHANGAFTFILNGATYGNHGYVCTTTEPGDIIDTNALSFSVFYALDVIMGTGLQQIGQTISISDTGVVAGSYGSASSVATYSVNAQGQLTSSSSVAIAITASQVTDLSTVLAAYLPLVAGSGNVVTGTIFSSAAIALESSSLSTLKFVSQQNDAGGGTIFDKPSDLGAGYLLQVQSNGADMMRVEGIGSPTRFFGTGIRLAGTSASGGTLQMSVPANTFQIRSDSTANGSAPALTFNAATPWTTDANAAMVWQVSGSTCLDLRTHFVDESSALNFYRTDAGPIKIGGVKFQRNNTGSLLDIGGFVMKAADLVGTHWSPESTTGEQDLGTVLHNWGALRLMGTLTSKANVAFNGTHVTATVFQYGGVEIFRLANVGGAVGNALQLNQDLIPNGVVDLGNGTTFAFRNIVAQNFVGREDVDAQFQIGNRTSNVASHLLSVLGQRGWDSDGTADGRKGGTLFVGGNSGGNGSGAFNPGAGNDLQFKSGNAGTGGTGNAAAGIISILNGTKSGTGALGTIAIGTDANTGAINIGILSSTTTTIGAAANSHLSISSSGAILAYNNDSFECDTAGGGILSLKTAGVSRLAVSTIAAFAVGVKLPIATKSTTYSITDADSTILADATSSGFTITLPAVASSSGRVLTVKKIDATANAVTLSGDGLVDGSSTLPITVPNASYSLQCNGALWVIL